jgi:hypothetical protein
MNTPLPLIPNHPLTQADRAHMAGVEIRLRPVFAGWEGSVISAESGEEIAYTPVQDTAMAAALLSESLWMDELRSRLAELARERWEAANQVEPKSAAECHGRRF